MHAVRQCLPNEGEVCQANPNCLSRKKSYRTPRLATQKGSWDARGTLASVAQW